MKKICFLVMVFALQFAYAQEPEEEDKTADFHRVTLVMGHAHVPEGIQNGKKQWLTLGAWGFDYDYWFRPRWAIGLHSDIVVENFEVEQSGDEEDESEGVLKRSYPLATALMGIFQAGEHIKLLLGAGGEFASEGSFFLVRAGLEYGWELPGDWELGFSLSNDFKVDAYNSWTMGVGISKIIGKMPEGREE